MLAYIIILTLYLAVPITLATAALTQPEIGMRRKAVPVKVPVRTGIAGSFRRFNTFSVSP